MTRPAPPEHEPLLTPGQVATIFNVNPKTVTRWADSGQLTSIRTLGGHRRYRESEIRELLATPRSAPPGLGGVRGQNSDVRRTVSS